jgi:hypothetical protein
MAQQRKFSRLPFRSASTLTAPGHAARLPARLIDVSLKGALVEAPGGTALAPGTPVVLSIQLDDSAVTILMEAEVVHRSRGRLGLRCTSIDMESMIHLRRLMELNLGDPGLLERELGSLG